MGFFDKVKGSFRDSTRDDICFGLRSLGIDAQMAERGRAEEYIKHGSISVWPGFTECLGVIDIPEGPIRWVNVFRKTEFRSEFGGGSPIIIYRTVYGVPDPRVDESLRVIVTHDGPIAGWGQSHWAPPEIRTPEIKLLCIRYYSPSVGEAVDLRWQGDDLGLGIIDRLKGDISINQPTVMSHHVTICAVPDHRCWIISPETETGRPPSGELWSCYQAIAQHLLAEWPPGFPKDEPKGGGSQ